MAKTETTNGERPTVREIASRSGVSVATVSRVLNGRPDVAPATREAVLKHIRDGAYVTNRIAKALATGGRTGLIALTVPYINAEYFVDILSGASETLYEYDARLVVCPTEHQHDREVSILERVMHGTTDGAILILPSESNLELERLHQQRFPFVVIDPSTTLNDDIPAVSSNHFAGARTIVHHLTSLGHRDIAVVTGWTYMTAAKDRIAGYNTALADIGVSPQPDLMVEGDWNLESGYQAMKQLLRRRKKPTAVFALNDQMAVGVMQALREAHIRVPEDISVVGFDDTQIASLTHPGLTTVHQPLQEMGRMAVSLLYRMLEGQALEATRLELSTRLVVRESTGPAPKVAVRVAHSQSPLAE